MRMIKTVGSLRMTISFNLKRVQYLLLLCDQLFIYLFFQSQQFLRDPFVRIHNKCYKIKK